MLQKWVIALTVAGAVHAGSVSAMSLGQVELLSALNQPFEAIIDLVDTGNITPDQITPLLGSVKDFKRAGVARPDYLEHLIFKTVEQDGKIKIQVSSKIPVKEPFISFLLEVRWPKKRLLREYTVLLDPPSFATREVAMSSDKSKADDEVGSYQTDIYKVKKDDSLWEIAQRFVPDKEFSIEQMMVALQKMNPQAFMQGNPDKLKNSVTLAIPTEEEILALTGDSVSAHAHDVIPANISRGKDDSKVEKTSKEGIRKLTEDNVKLIKQLKKLEKQIASLETVIDKTDTEIDKKGKLNSNTHIAEKKSVLGAVTSEETNHSQTSGNNLPPGRSVFEYTHDTSLMSGSKSANSSDSLLPDRYSRPHTHPPLEQKKSLYDVLMDNLYHLVLGAGGLLLMLLLGCTVIKRKKQRQEEKEMEAILAAEAEEEERKQQESVEPHAASEDKVVFSELLAAREQKGLTDAKEKNSSDSESPEVINAGPSSGEKEGREEIEALLAEEENSLSLNMNEDSVLAQETGPPADIKQVVEETLENEELLSTEQDVNEAELDIVKIAPENGDNVLEDKDISEQLEQLDEEINSLAEDFSLSEDEENEKADEAHEVEENTSMASLLDLARAYLEMGDIGEARDILNKVSVKGDAAQKSEAEELLKRCK